MDWTELKDRIERHRFEVRKTGEGKRDWIFCSDEGDPIDGIDFQTLGAGTNKIAVRVRGQPWVLLFGKTGRQIERMSFREEVATLEVLGGRGLRVPEPFNGGKHAQYVFDINVWNDGEEADVPAFFQEYMAHDQFVEMTKTTPLDRDSFARNHIVIGERVPATIETTLTDLHKIDEQFRAQPWGDFQVMYNRLNGGLYVFDPLPSDPNQIAYQHSIETWFADIRAAMETDPQWRMKESIKRYLKMMGSRPKPPGKGPRRLIRST